MAFIPRKTCIGLLRNCWTEIHFLTHIPSWNPGYQVKVRLRLLTEMCWYTVLKYKLARSFCVCLSVSVSACACWNTNLVHAVSRFCPIRVWRAGERMEACCLRLQAVAPDCEDKHLLWRKRERASFWYSAECLPHTVVLSQSLTVKFVVAETFSF